ncbi:GNAT family N-acetyltransferase [uncultured Jannaschia sp.]|uniref:GNAT family N-acetyltransferase n=1 Tax=uncultured Jannaschia sp. TaxID=293347 RepID=UPI0026395251|nr:GNAT family N-acetyltransferase [uncultured Jannaschia sp.]
MIRSAVPEDARACAAVLNDWIDATPWMPRVHPPDDVERHYRESVPPQQRVFVAERDDRIDGFVAVAADGETVSGLYLAPEAHGRGLGPALLDAVREGPQRLWTLRTNEGARRFYAREGFREVRQTEGDNEEGLPDILFGRCI